MEKISNEIQNSFKNKDIDTITEKKLILERINAAHKFHQSKQNKQSLH